MNTHISRKTVITVLAVTLLFGAGLILNVDVNVNTALAGACQKDMTTRTIDVSGKAHIVNNSDVACDYYLASYKINFNGSGVWPYIPQQTLHDQDHIRLGGNGGTGDLSVSVPHGCEYQLDVLNIEPWVSNPNYSSANFLGVQFGGPSGVFCNAPQEPTPTPTQTTLPTPTTALVAPTVDLKCDADPGTGLVFTNGPCTNFAAILNWTSTNATTCVASAPAPSLWSGTKLTSGPETVETLTTPRTYTLTCFNAVGSVSDSVTVLPIVIATPTNNPTPTPGSVSCSPVVQSAQVGEFATLFAAGGNGVYTWSAPSGTPSSGTGSTFSTRFFTGGTKVVTITSPNAPQTDVCVVSVSDISTPTPTSTPNVLPPTVDIRCDGTNGPCSIPVGSASTLSWVSSNATSCNAFGNWSGALPLNHGGISTGALFNNQTYSIVCSGPGGSNSDFVTVNVFGGFTPNPTPTVAPLQCFPNSQSTESGQLVSFVATGGTGSYTWFASSGTPSNGSGSTFSTRFFTGSNQESRSATVTSGSQSASCAVTVFSAATPTPNGFATISKTVRNLTTNSGEVNAVAASPNDTIEFIIRVSSVGSNNLTNVRVLDFMPGNMTYQANSTTVDGNFQNDGIVQNGISLGNMSSNRTVVIRFRATVAAQGSFSVGTTSLTNTAQVLSDNGSTSDVAIVDVFRSSGAVDNQNLQIGIQKLGRNITRGEANERTSVLVSPGNTLEFIIRVRSLSNVTLNNVIIRDVLPAGLQYIQNTTSINNTITANGIVSGGINIGSLIPGQETVIKLSALVEPGTTFPNGAFSVTNVAQANADNTPIATAQLLISRGSIQNIAQIQTGPVDSLIFATLLSGLVTFGYMRYTGTDGFRKREAMTAVKRYQGDAKRLNFARFL